MQRIPFTILLLTVLMSNRQFPPINPTLPPFAYDGFRLKGKCCETNSYRCTSISRSVRDGIDDRFMVYNMFSINEESNKAIEVKGADRDQTVFERARKGMILPACR